LYYCVYTEHLVRVLPSNFLWNYFKFNNVFKEWCSKLIQYASRWMIKCIMYILYIRITKIKIINRKYVLVSMRIKNTVYAEVICVRRQFLFTLVIQLIKINPYSTERLQNDCRNISLQFCNIANKLRNVFATLMQYHSIIKMSAFDKIVL